MILKRLHEKIEEPFGSGTFLACGQNLDTQTGGEGGQEKDLSVS